MLRALKARKTGLLVLFLIQGACLVLLALEALADAFAIPHEPLEVLELLIVFALISSTAFTGYELLKLLRRNKRMAEQLKIASGAFADVLADFFDEWGLTPSERDVAQLAIKGFSISDIARLRETKEGTIKAQCNAVYRKAGVNGRPQLVSLFVEELMAEELLPPKQAAAVRAAS